MGLIQKLKDLNKNKDIEDIAREIGGEYIQPSILGSDKLLYDYKKWRMKLDFYADGEGGPNLRIRVPFKSLSEFNCYIYREGLFSMIGKTFGMQDIIIGDHEFDRQFIIKSNDEFHVKKFLELAKLKEAFEDIDDPHLRITKESYSIDSYPPGDVQHLVFHANFPIPNKQQIKNVFELFGLILDHLVKLNLASDEKAGYEYP